MSNLDLKDVVGSDTKLEAFINSVKINNKLELVPKLGERDIFQLKAVGIKTTNELIGVFASFNFKFEECVDYMRSIISGVNTRHVVVTILYKLNKIFTIPDAPENWRNY